MKQWKKRAWRFHHWKAYLWSLLGQYQIEIVLVFYCGMKTFTRTFHRQNNKHSLYHLNELQAGETIHRKLFLHQVMDKVLDHPCVGSVDTILYWCPIRRNHSVYLSNKQIAFSSRKYKVRVNLKNGRDRGGAMKGWVGALTLDQTLQFTTHLGYWNWWGYTPLDTFLHVKSRPLNLIMLVCCIQVVTKTLAHNTCSYVTNQKERKEFSNIFRK